jgi:hypothetical protein
MGEITVAELVARLQELPQDLPAYVRKRHTPLPHLHLPEPRVGLVRLLDLNAEFPLRIPYSARAVLL